MDVSQDIIEKKLLRLLPDWDGEPAPLYMVCADRRLLSPTLRKFQEFLKNKCEQQHTKALAALSSQRVNGSSPNSL